MLYPARYWSCTGWLQGGGGGLFEFSSVTVPVAVAGPGESVALFCVLPSASQFDWLSSYPPESPVAVMPFCQMTTWILQCPVVPSQLSGPLALTFVPPPSRCSGELKFGF